MMDRQHKSTKKSTLRQEKETSLCVSVGARFSGGL